MSHSLSSPLPVSATGCATGFVPEYVEDLSACGPRGLVECFEVGLPSAPGAAPSSCVTLRIRGSLAYALAFSARYWSLFVLRPALRVQQGLPAWPAAWVPPGRLAA